MINHPLGSGGNVITFFGGFRDVWVASITDTTSSTGINNLNTTSDFFTVSPNPSNGIFIIKGSISIETIAELYNYQGQLLRNINTSKSEETILDISGYSQGIYFLKINFNEKIITKKIIKVN